jgi:uncharacterized protein YbaR (Trm112 family)
LLRATGQRILIRGSGRAPTAKKEILVVLRETLLKILVCPVDKGCLMYFADEDLLYNARLRRAYRIADGVPVMLAERAEPVTEEEHERLITRAREGSAGLSAAGLAGQLPGGRGGRAYPFTANAGIAGPASDGRSAPA